MKKRFLFLVAAVAVSCLALVGCGGSKESKKCDIALITDSGNIDDKSFNEGAWKGVEQYGKENNLVYKYFKPTEDSASSRKDAIVNAVSRNGAKMIVCPGFSFASIVYELQTTYPEVQFLLIDTEPHNEAGTDTKIGQNVHCILYQEEQAGYLAGYAAVKDGYTKLGFLGGQSDPAVVRYGYGFVQGANAAAAELGNSAQVSVKYWYAGSYSPNDDIQTKMTAWYADGTEVVFSCGGGIYLSATKAAEAAGAKVIGVDVDQSSESKTIITSAMKGITTSVVMSLQDAFNNGGKWSTAMAGKTAILGAADNCVGLPTATESWKFNKFTVTDYNTLFESVKNGTVQVSNVTDVQPTVQIAVDYQQ